MTVVQDGQDPGSSTFLERQETAHIYGLALEFIHVISQGVGYWSATTRATTGLDPTENSMFPPDASTLPLGCLGRSRSPGV